LGEGPHWDPRVKRLYYVDILGKAVLSYCPNSGELVKYDVGSLVGCLAPSKNDPKVLVLGTQEGIQHLDVETGKVRMFIEYGEIEPDRPSNRFNHGKVDPKGRFWVGSMTSEENQIQRGVIFLVDEEGRFQREIELDITPKMWIGTVSTSSDEEEQRGSLYRIDTDGHWECVIQKVSISNGMAWSVDLKHYYYIDSLSYCVARYDFDEWSGKISNRHEVISIPNHWGVPAGMAIDSGGMLWVAIYSGHMVTQWDPHTGKCLLKVKIPCPYITNVCFGGEDLGTLYVTCAARRTNKENYPNAGSLFAIKNLGVKGVPMNNYG